MGKYIPKKGDRVLYVGSMRPDWHGNPATVKRVAANDHIELRFDKPHSGNCSDGYGFMINDLVPYNANAIDTSKPLLIRNSQGQHPVTLIGVLHDDQLIVEVPYGAKMDRGWYIYDLEGKFVRSATGGGRATTLENKPDPVITKGYINIGGSNMNGGRGVLDAPVNQEGMNLGIAVIELTLTDGIVTGAELIQPGTTMKVDVRPA